MRPARIRSRIRKAKKEKKAVRAVFELHAGFDERKGDSVTYLVKISVTKYSVILK